LILILIELLLRGIELSTLGNLLPRLGLDESVCGGLDGICGGLLIRIGSHLRLTLWLLLLVLLLGLLLLLLLLLLSLLLL
jgi:hypothetical protein